MRNLAMLKLRMVSLFTGKSNMNYLLKAGLYKLNQLYPVTFSPTISQSKIDVLYPSKSEVIRIDNVDQ